MTPQKPCEPQTLSEALQSAQSKKTPLEVAFQTQPEARGLAKRLSHALGRNKPRDQVPAAASPILPPLP